MRFLDRLQRLAAVVTRRPYVWGWVVLVAVLACVGAQISTQVWTGKHGDLRLYFVSATRFMHGAVPYRDFRLEYPPFALAAFVVPYLIGRRWFEKALLLSNCGWIIGIGICVVVAAHLATSKSEARVSERETPANSLAQRAPLMFTLLVLACSPLVPWRYDLFPSVLTALAFVCLLKQRPSGAGIFLGLGTAAKLYPVILGPVFVLYYAARRQWGPALRCIVGAVIATLIPFAYVLTTANTKGALSFFRYHGMRGIQIESLFSGAVLLTRFGSPDVKVTTGSGSWNLSFPGDHAAVTLQGVLLLVGLLAAYWACWRRFRSSDTASLDVAALAAGSCSVLLTFIATNKVFSPQYVAWLLPFAPLLPLRQGLAAVLLFVLTVCIYPASYDALLALQLDAVVLLNTRNALAVVLIFWIFWKPAQVRVAQPGYVAPIATGEHANSS